MINDPNTRLPERFRHELENHLVDLHGYSSSPSSVRSLTLVGLDLLALEDGENHPIPDWGNLQALALKSCSQLESTIIKLAGAGGSYKSQDVSSRNPFLKTPIFEAGENFLVFRRTSSSQSPP